MLKKIWPMNNAQGRRLNGAGIILAIVAVIAVGALLSKGNSPSQPSHSEKTTHEGTFKTGDVVWSKYDDRKIPGCKTDEDVYRYHRHGRENDVDAQTAMVLTARCRMLPIAVQMTVEQTKFLSDNVCVSLQGEVDCLWTNGGWLKK